MNPITVFQLASWTIGLWDNWIVGIEAGAGPILAFALTKCVYAKTQFIYKFSGLFLNFGETLQRTSAGNKTGPI